MKIFVSQYLDEPTYSCMRDDGVHNMSMTDLLNPTYAALSLDAALAAALADIHVDYDEANEPETPDHAAAAMLDCHHVATANHVTYTSHEYVVMLGADAYASIVIHEHDI